MFNIRSTLHQQGFTFIELVVVLLIVSLALAIVAPKVVVGSRQMKERGFVVALQSIMERSRLKAMALQQPMVIWIYGKERQIAFGSDRVDIPENVDVYGQGLTESPKGYYLKFFPDGSSSAEKLEIVFNGKRKVFILFNPVTGSIHWYEETSS